MFRRKRNCTKDLSNLFSGGVFGATVLNSAGAEFVVTTDVKNSLGSESRVAVNVLDSDGNSFTIFT